MAAWTTALADNRKFCLQYEVRSTKIHVSGPDILLIGKQPQMGNIPFNISLASYIGKPQTLHNACCWFESLSRKGYNGWELSWLSSAYSNKFRENTWLEYDSPFLKTYTLNIAYLTF